MGRPKGRGNYEYFVDEDGFMHCPVDDCSFKSSKSVPDNNHDFKSSEYKQWREQSKAECRRHIKRTHEDFYEIPRATPRWPSSQPGGDSSVNAGADRHHPYAARTESPRLVDVGGDDPEGTANLLALLPFGINPSKLIGSKSSTGETPGTPIPSVSPPAGTDKDMDDDASDQRDQQAAALAISKIGSSGMSMSQNQTLFASLSALHQTAHETLHVVNQSRKEDEMIKSILKQLIEKVDALTSKVDALSLAVIDDTIDVALGMDEPQTA